MDDGGLARIKRRLRDLEGAKIKTQYSKDGISWHSGVSEADKYLRFSSDSGASWGEALLFKGPAGAAGAPGADGQRGTQGAKGVSYVMNGEYDARTAYHNDAEHIDCVTYGGSSYYAKRATAGNPPTDETYWGVLALKGSDGAGNVAGPQTNTDSKFPQWNGADSRTLKDGMSIAEILAAAYPVGSLYFNASNSANPSTLLGFGTWTAFGAGRVLVGYAPGDPDFGTAGAAIGEKTHTLTAAEMPQHTHAQNAHTHAQNPHNHAQDAHSHGPGTLAGYYKIRDNDDSGTVVWGGLGYLYTAYDTNSAAGSVVINFGATGSATAENQSATATNQNATATNINAGGGAAHNNIQPSIVVYIWKRTA